MERIIYKFKLRESVRQTVMMQINAKILSVQIQHKEISLWAEVDRQAELEQRTILAFPTGAAFQPKEGKQLVYLATLQFNEGYEIYHFYEEINE